MEKVESRTITVYPSEWKEFGSVCNKKGYDRSKLIRIWINTFITKHKD